MIAPTAGDDVDGIPGEEFDSAFGVIFFGEARADDRVKIALVGEGIAGGDPGEEEGEEIDDREDQGELEEAIEDDLVHEVLSPVLGD